MRVEEKPAAEKKPRREFGLGTAQSLASVPAMVLEDDLASQLVVEESEVFDDPFYEALVATEEEWPEAEPEPETEADTESEPKPADAKAADETPDEADESIDDAEELPNTTASGLLADGEQSEPAPAPEPAAASAEAAPSSDDAAVEAPAEMTPESVETPEHEPEPKSEPEPEPSKPAEETASSTETVATKKPGAKPHGFRAWLHRLFHHS